MEECCDHLCVVCLGYLCAKVCNSCCESTHEPYTRNSNNRRNERGPVEFVDMYPLMQQPRRLRNPNDDDVFNISGRVNNQQDTASNWPTHDHRISVDFGLSNEYIKDTRPPPPPYAEVDLPSYEQATGCNPVRNELTPVHQTTSSRPGPSQ